MKKYIGEIGLMLTAIIWGSGFVGSAVALDTYTPYQILAGRFLIGAVLLCVVFHKKLKSIPKSALLKGAILGIFLYIAFVLQTVGLQYTTPSKNAFLTAVNVVVVPFIGLAIYKKKLDAFELMGAFLAMFGVAVLSLQWSAGVNFGDFLSLCCAIGFAFHIFYTAQFVKQEDPIILTIVQMATATIIGIVVVLLKGETSFSMQSEGLTSLLYLGVFSTTIAFLLQTVSQKFITETKAAIILSTESLWGMVFSVILLSEIVTFKMGIGAVLILAAIILSETKLSFFNRKKASLIKVEPK
ncbi:DMT family transporter [Sporosarcina thermotolerans]|uniref:DMT family transporter n=1 Tax=Sporosarcina thermotolerans TaxID=633404 RepID=A0AAW9AA49_9BACL|nr:DMT family transporter [Sporosarcina thermotolerans]MDW0116815.1 DMT family transporter [Sporosarcina thermotolerans]WHT48990.1 DMT family transporter [Sporosarcina thermotolerans]